MAYTVTPDTTASDVLDRMHLIHQTISVSGLTINCKRYYPANPEQVAGDVIINPSAPLAIAFNQDREQSYTITRTFQIMVWVKGWLQGIPGESSQRILEQVIEPIEEAYMTRLRLELRNETIGGVTYADGGISGVLDALLTRGRAYSGQGVLRPTITYDLNVRMLKTVRPG